MITQYYFDVALFEDAVVSDHGVAHACPEALALNESAEVILRLVLRVAVEALDQLLSLDEEGRVEGDVRGEEGLLVLLIKRGVGSLGWLLCWGRSLKARRRFLLVVCHFI